MIQLYNGDCLDILKTIPDSSVDLILTDPPYEHTNGGFGHSSLGHRAAKLKSDIDFMSHSFDMGGYLKNFYGFVKYRISLYFVLIDKYLK